MGSVLKGVRTVVIVVLDPGYDLSYKALYTYSRSIALTQFLGANIILLVNLVAN